MINDANRSLVWPGRSHALWFGFLTRYIQLPLLPPLSPSAWFLPSTLDALFCVPQLAFNSQHALEFVAP
jgi:hypothetical protein